MPRTDVNDNRILHNLQGIDLRKNAESNSAEDMVNVWFNSQHYFTNRPMPSVYTVGQTAFNRSYKFACECKNLAGSEVEIDISSAEAKVPNVGLAVTEATDDSGEIWITGMNLETIRSILWITTAGGALVSGIDFSFYYDREHNRLAITTKEGMAYDDYEYFVLISPYGMVTTQFVGSIPDYYFGPYNEYRLRTYSFNGIPQLSIEAKQANGSYRQIQVMGNSAVTGKPDKKKHYPVRLGTNPLAFNYDPNDYSRFAYFDVSTTSSGVVLTLTSYGLDTCNVWSGGQSVGEQATDTGMVEFYDDLYLGLDNRFKFASTETSVTLSELVGDTYNPIAEYTEL